MTRLQLAIAWMGAQLGVIDLLDARQWLVQLVVPGPVTPQRVSDPALVPDVPAWCRRQWGLHDGARWYHWLISAIWLPLAPGVASGVSDILSGIGDVFSAAWTAFERTIDGVRWVFWWMFWPIRFAMHQLDRVAAAVDFGRVVRPAENLLLPILMHPVVWPAVLVVTGLFFVMVITTPFSWFGQLIFLATCWAVSMVLRRLPGRYPAMALFLLSMIAMGRYAWWRITTTLEFDTWTEAALGTGLLLAEMYTWLVVVFGFIQTVWPLQRKPAPLPADRSLWPTVDVYIPTYNEPMSVVRPTTMAAMALDWPHDKLRIYILDDGRRAEFRAFAESVGVGYMIRPDNKHAKAGNLNHAMKQTQGELVAIFDCDHMPTRSFLQMTVGWMMRDPKCAMLQTPHHFFSPDPFERNLGTFRRVPNEGTLFYGLAQDGNDFWNATFFCGSCAVIRRKPLLEVGGIAVETVTEDAHTALKMQRLGYNTAYINMTQAAGLATESLSAHVGQRIRWARGMAQIFRVDNPLLGKGLSIFQRICYANAMMHFFYGLPRLVFLTAPMAYLFFELHIIGAAAGMLALYVVPYIVQSNVANAHIQGVHRHSFWAEVYETVLAWYIILPTTVALINPKAGTFNVTAKGGLVEHSYFDWVISKPYLLLASVNLLAFGIGLMRFFVWNAHESGTVALNLIWTIYNVLILGASIGVATESRQIRRTHRVVSTLQAAIQLANGNVVRCTSEDYSMQGMGFVTPPELLLTESEKVNVILWRGDDEFSFPMRVMVSRPGVLGLRLMPLSVQQEIDYVQCTFARADAWSQWSEQHHADRPLEGLKEIALLGLQGYRTLAGHIANGIRGWFNRSPVSN